MNASEVRRIPELVAAARTGLPLHQRVHGVPLGERAIAAAAFDGLLGFVANAISLGEVRCADHRTAEIRRLWAQSASGTVAVEAMIVRTAAILERHGVRWRLTKGAALAHLDYGDQLAARTFRDMDLMVHPADWETALRALGEAGYRRLSPELRRGYDREFGKGATLREAQGGEADLHLRFAIGRFGVRSVPEDLLRRHDSIVLADTEVPTLAGPDRLLHACHHLVLGGASALRAARDVAQLLLVSRVDWVDTVETACRWRAQAVVVRAVLLTWARLGLEVEHPALNWARSQSVGALDRAAIDVFARGRPFREQALTALTALPPRKVPAFVLAHARPASGRRAG